MKQYVCHKRVKAAQIIEIREFVQLSARETVSALGLVLSDGGRVHEMIGEGILARYTPVVGDYLVEYEGDGYRSISPKTAFEEGYHEFTPETAP